MPHTYVPRVVWAHFGRGRPGRVEQGTDPDPRAEVANARARIDLTLLEAASRLDAEALTGAAVPEPENATS